MKVEVAVVADYANTAEGGKLNVMGMFDHISAASFPSTHASMVLALRLRLDFEDREKDHAIKVQLVDEDGRLMGGGDWALKVGAIPPGERQIVSQLLSFVNTEFQRPGEYAFVLSWDGEEKARIPLTLSLRPPQPA